jgi:hypothetical protein
VGQTALLVAGDYISYNLRQKCAIGFYLKLRKSDKCSRCYKKLVDLK